MRGNLNYRLCFPICRNLHNTIVLYFLPQVFKHSLFLFSSSPLPGGISDTAVKAGEEFSAVERCILEVPMLFSFLVALKILLSIDFPPKEKQKAWKYLFNICDLGEHDHFFEFFFRLFSPSALLLTRFRRTTVLLRPLSFPQKTRKGSFH